MENVIRLEKPVRVVKMMRNSLLEGSYGAYKYSLSGSVLVAFITVIKVYHPCPEFILG